MSKKEFQVQVLLYSGSGWMDFGPTTQLGSKVAVGYAALALGAMRRYANDYAQPVGIKSCHRTEGHPLKVCAMQESPANSKGAKREK